MSPEDLKMALDEHDVLLAKCARGELGVREFFAVYDSFYQRWALDGHEGDATVLARFAERIAVHREVWDQVECHITNEDHASNPAHTARGFIGEKEALKRLQSIARQGGLVGSRCTG
jgi:hypothetical protein